MTPERRKSRIARWGVPVGAVAVTGIVAVAYGVSGAQAAPKLPARTTVQLLASVSSAQQPAPMTATIQETASLGLPSLPSLGSSSSSSSDPMSALSWVSGTHTIRIWYADQAHVRVAVPVPMGETDLRRDGRNVWTWDSQNDQATHLVLPAHLALPAQPGAASGSSVTHSSSGSAAYSSTLTITQPTPQQVARQVLAAVGPTTSVGLQQNVTIAGQPAYQLSLTPKGSGSLIGQIRIAIDARRALPLRVQIFARGASSPAFSVGYTSIQFGTPAASNFAFTPPRGAKVKTVTAPAAPPRMLTGSAPLVATPPGAVKFRKLKVSQIVSSKAGAPKALSQKARQHLLVRLRKLAKGAPKAVALPRGFTPGGPMIGTAGLASSGTQVLGKSWTSVLVLPAPGLTQWVPPGAAMPRGSASYSSSSGRQVVQFKRQNANVIAGRPTTFRQVPLAAGGLPQVIGELMRAATPVHGAWGSGRLLTTSLVSVLVTSNGHMLIGSVTPAVLYADAAQLLKQEQSNKAQPGKAQPGKAQPGKPAKTAKPKPASVK